MKEKELRPPNGRLFFSGAVAVAICVGTVIKASFSGWVSTVAGLAGAVVVALAARLWHRQADLRYRRARALAEEQNGSGDTTL
ncbi:hypothetical protein K2224_39060 (plasmid) [Streptomyces sp. BHT-5-2]|uniref:hypothetical protein n=1 Tax=Streptomyces sp. BHT-5-2 TaxID=2866715 RepID=UPI001C8EEC38|nr:hypothetical protein [Streptomyces sp. BHT-5-2]QZL08985.1 hypothetical protein K2224_39060 [Streptomyces sp. BHT-5-2]